MEKCENLAWIDLSHNYLEVLDYVYDNNNNIIKHSL